MTDINTQSQLLTDLAITIGPAELIQKIRTKTVRPAILTAAEQTLDLVAGCWNPVIVCRWLPVAATPGTDGTITLNGDAGPVQFDLGHSSRFIEPAGQALVAAYTAGPAIEEETRKASANQDYLASYIIDLIALLVLEKTGDLVKQIAEQQAADKGWKVSPFLSPGSIHGWELEEQVKLCSLLPLGKAGISMREDGILTPYKSLACMIGIGAGYTSTTVGTTCHVCSKRLNCEMQHAHEG